MPIRASLRVVSPVCCSLTQCVTLHSAAAPAAAAPVATAPAEQKAETKDVRAAIAAANARFMFAISQQGKSLFDIDLSVISVLAMLALQMSLRLPTATATTLL